MRKIHILRKTTLRKTTLRKRRAHHKKRHTRKQSGGRVDMAKLKLVLNHRERATELANVSSKKAHELKELIESRY